MLWIRDIEKCSRYIIKRIKAIKCFFYKCIVYLCKFITKYEFKRSHKTINVLVVDQVGKLFKIKSPPNIGYGVRIRYTHEEMVGESSVYLFWMENNWKYLSMPQIKLLAYQSHLFKFMLKNNRQYMKRCIYAIE